MLGLAIENLYRAFNSLINEDIAHKEMINKYEDEIDFINRSMASFFIKLVSTPVSNQDKKLIGGLHHVINDIERIGDHAILLVKETASMKKGDIRFIDKTKIELRDIYMVVSKLSDFCTNTLESRSPEKLEATSKVHEKIRTMVRAAGEVDFERMTNGLTTAEASKSLYVVLNTFQRVSDHLVNIAYSILSDTGCEREAFENLKKLKKHRSVG